MDLEIKKTLLLILLVIREVPCRKCVWEVSHDKLFGIQSLRQLCSARMVVKSDLVWP